MSEKIRDEVMNGFLSFPPEYWIRYIERILPSLRNERDDKKCLENVKYHISQVMNLYHEHE